MCAYGYGNVLCERERETLQPAQESQISDAPICTFVGVGVCSGDVRLFSLSCGRQEVKKEESELWKLSGSDSVLPS